MKRWLLVAGLLSIVISNGFARREKSAFKELKNVYNQGLDSVPSPEIISPNIVAPDTMYGKGVETVGLVLSGGGAKGIAHVGVIKALEDNNIPIDYVTGTSMGAIVGSLYSCGWSPERMMELFTSKDFTYWSTGTIPKEDIYYYIQPNPVPKWVEVNLNLEDKSTITNQIIPTSLISPLPMNIEFLKLYGPYTEQCGENFNNLFVPFRCVTSDIYHKHKVVLSEGSLGESVRASMSFPLVFRPIKLDGVLMYDGGIYDNFPVNVMKQDFNPDFMIGVSVSGADTAPIQGDIYSQLEDMIIQNNDYSLPEKYGVKIQVPVLNFGVLQFDKAQTIYEIGYKTGMAMVDSIKSRIKARRSLAEVTERREQFAAKTPALVFDSIKVTGANPDQTRYLKFLFDGGNRHPFGIEQTRKAYYRAVTDGALNNLVPLAQFGPHDRNTLLLEASVKRPWSIGVGGWVSTSTNSMLFLTLGYHTLNLNSLNVNLNAWVGQTYMAAQLSGRFTFPSRIPSLIEVEGVLSRQKYYNSELLFYETNTPSFITEMQAFLRANYIWAVGSKAKGFVSLGGGLVTDSYYPDNDSSTGHYKDKNLYNLGMLKVGMEKNTLDNILYPSLGENWEWVIRGALESTRFHPGDPELIIDRNTKRSWASISAKWKRFCHIYRNIRLGIAAEGQGMLRKLTQNYIAEMVHATEFAPTPSTRNYFNEAFRSDNYLAVGLIPMWTPIRNFQLRGDFYGYSPIRNMVNTGQENPARYDGWFKKFHFIGEVAAVYSFPFASLSIYGNYLSYPARNWNFGINFGLFFQAPKLMH